MIQDLVRTWWPVLAFLLNGCFVLIIWALVKTFARKEDVEALRRDIREIKPKLDGLDRISNLLLENELKEKN